MGSEMCIRDREDGVGAVGSGFVDLGGVDGEILTQKRQCGVMSDCLLYTSDAADERSSVDLGGRRIIKKKKGRARGGEGSG